MKLKTVTLLFCMMGLFAACGQEENIPDPKQPEPKPEMGSRTVVAYIAADNSLSSFSTKDLNEMLEGIKDVDTRTNNMLVYIDRGNVEPLLIRICRNMENTIIKDTVQTYDIHRNSVGIEEMTEVLSSVVEQFPAEGYGLILWSHGDGWIPSSSVDTRWIGQDTDSGKKDKRMNIADLHTVLKKLPRLDYLFFDACYMQSIEVVYELRDCADYFIGSPTEIPGPGAPYQDVVPQLFAKNNAAVSIAGSYFDFYNNLYNGGEGMSNDIWTGGVSLAVLESSKLEALAAATCQLPIYTSREINTAKIQCYDILRDRHYHDLGGLSKSLADAALYQQWEAAYRAATVYAKTTELNYNTYNWGSGQMVSMKGFTGVSIYLLSGNPTLDRYVKTFAWYSASGGK